MNSTADIYGNRANGDAHGDVFTSPEIVRFMLDLTGYTSEKDLSKSTILEPSCGIGDFLIEIQRRIIISAERYGVDAEQAFSNNVYACDIDADKMSHCIRILRERMPQFKATNFRHGDFLTSSWDISFDYIVGNPPYVSYANIPDNLKKLYKHKFRTFHYRTDLYILFYEHSLRLLSKNGKHCFICSDRWLKNESGRKLRAFISANFDVEYIIDIESLKAFKEAVLAYPSITVISNSKKSTSVKTARIERIESLYTNIKFDDKVFPDNDNWNSIFLKDNTGGLYTIEQQGFSIGIGVATGSDKVFISKTLYENIETELLIPLITAKDLTGNYFQWSGRYLLNPYNQSGNLIDLEKYPKAKSYLSAHKEALSQRHIVRNNRTWYALIDKVKPHLTERPKVLLPDISGNDFIFVDSGQYYPGHNIYYIAGGDITTMELIAAILMSSFVKNQIMSISNKMNGGLPRWQSQTIRKLRIPSLSQIRPKEKDAILYAYQQKDFQTIDILVSRIVKSQRSGAPSRKSICRQPSLFDQQSFLG